MNWKAAIKHAIPPSVLNNTLLTFPFLYKTKLVNYETNIFADNGIEELLTHLGQTLDIEGRYRGMRLLTVRGNRSYGESSA